MEFETESKEKACKMWSVPLDDVELINMRKQAPRMVFVRCKDGRKAFFTSN